jgi:hypothetical protein
MLLVRFYNLFWIYSEFIPNTLIEFYRQVMARHDHLSTGQNDDSDEAGISTAAVVTPTRAPLVPPTLPSIPRKKDHSVSSAFWMYCDRVANVLRSTKRLSRRFGLKLATDRNAMHARQQTAVSNGFRMNLEWITNILSLPTLSTWLW